MASGSVLIASDPAGTLPEGVDDETLQTPEWGNLRKGTNDENENDSNSQSGLLGGYDAA
jgi:hypothetical protein